MSPIKQHTTRSLARYLGMRVNVGPQFNGQDYRLGAVFFRNNFLQVFHYPTDSMHHSSRLYKPHQIYPVLYSIKTLAKNPEDILSFYGVRFAEINLTDSVILENPEREPIACILANFGIFVDDDSVSGYIGNLTPALVETLIEKGYGAIPNSESPTGYVDPLNYACVCGDENV